MTKAWLKRLFSFEPRSDTPAVAPGLYHAVQQAGEAFGRFHLRVEHDGSGMLIANASATAKLSPSGVVIAKALLDGLDGSEVLGRLKSAFRGADTATMQADVNKMQALITQMVSPEDMYPEFSMKEVSTSPYAAELIAPFQATVPISEAGTMSMLLDKLWEAGVPHVTLLLNTDADLHNAVRAVEHAEDLGMIAGVRATATLLNNPDLLTDLMQAGVDYITFIYASIDASVHDALVGVGDHAHANSLLTWLEEQQLCAVAEIPLVPATLDNLEETVEGLITNGADNLSFVAYVSTESNVAAEYAVFTVGAMPQVAIAVEEAAEDVNALFMWNPPVEYDVNKNTLKYHVLAGPRCSGEVAVRVEEDGNVIPPRGAYTSAGNLVKETWKTIWGNDTFRIYRESVADPSEDDLGVSVSSIESPEDPATWVRAEEA